MRMHAVIEIGCFRVKVPLFDWLSGKYYHWIERHNFYGVLCTYPVPWSPENMWLAWLRNTILAAWYSQHQCSKSNAGSNFRHTTKYMEWSITSWCIDPTEEEAYPTLLRWLTAHKDASGWSYIDNENSNIRFTVVTSSYLELTVPTSHKDEDLEITDPSEDPITAAHWISKCTIWGREAMI